MTDQGMITAADLKAELAKMDDNALIIGWKSEQSHLILEFAYIHRKPNQFYDIHIGIGKNREIRTERYKVGSESGK